MSQEHNKQRATLHSISLFNSVLSTTSCWWVTIKYYQRASLRQRQKKKKVDWTDDDVFNMADQVRSKRDLHRRNVLIESRHGSRRDRHGLHLFSPSHTSEVSGGLMEDRTGIHVSVGLMKWADLVSVRCWQKGRRLPRPDTQFIWILSRNVSLDPYLRGDRPVLTPRQRTHTHTHTHTAC